MALQFAQFTIPVQGAGGPSAELNTFLRAHRVICLHKEIVHIDQHPWWNFMIEYSETGNEEEKNAPKVDYKDLLTAEEFSLFSKLRDVRKRISEKQGIPIYAVFTNEQLSQIVTKKVVNKNGMASIKGIGEAKITAYGEDILSAILDNTEIPEVIHASGK